eukprot:TRINITY_DN14867_c0_g1_i1.p1 TRINITY_DN14867_c0_g1~~TRINITY_DN14867_c0_g1_i1.p1  ORF type:complete len:368 (-),score=106.61 TRINITY_DN14867_c0_g1_i1:46-1119(-)
MYVFGGCDKVINFSDLYKFHFETNTWIKGNCNGYSRRVFETAVVFKDAMYLYGGKNIHNYSFNELSKFTFESPIEVSCSDTYLNDLKHLLYSGEYSDVQFIFLKESKHLTAHRNILYARCERFREIINHWMKECADKEKQRRDKENGGSESQATSPKEECILATSPPRAFSPLSSPRSFSYTNGLSIDLSAFGSREPALATSPPSVSSSFSSTSPFSSSTVSQSNSRQTNSNILKIHIDNCRSDVFIILLEYIYVGIVDIGPKEAFDLLKVADEYKLVHLKSKCENIISQSVNEENVVHLYKLAWQYKAKYLKDYCLSVITDNYQKLSSTVKQELTPEMLKDIKKAFSSAYVPRAPM